MNALQEESATGRPLLQQLGHVTQANFVFREIVTYAKRTRISHDSEHEWADLARRSMDRNA